MALPKGFVITQQPTDDEPVPRPPAGFVVQTHLLDRNGVTGAEVKRRAAAGEIVDAGREDSTRGERMAALAVDAATGGADALGGFVGLVADAVSDTYSGGPLRRGASALYKTLRGEDVTAEDVRPPTPVLEVAKRAADDFRRAGREVTGTEHVDTGIVGDLTRFGVDVALPTPEAAMFARRVSAGARGVADAAEEAPGMIRRVAGPGPESLTVRRVDPPAPEPHVLMPDGRSIPESEYRAMVDAEANTAAVPDNVVPIRQEEPPIPPQAPPPVPQGMVRFYHGGVEGVDGPRWLTPDRDYAEGYARKSTGGTVQYVDIPEDSPLLMKAWDDSGTNMVAPYDSFEAPEEIARNLRPLRGDAPMDAAPVLVEQGSGFGGKAIPDDPAARFAAERDAYLSARGDKQAAEAAVTDARLAAAADPTSVPSTAITDARVAVDSATAAASAARATLQENPVQKVLTALREAKPIRQAQEAIYTKTRAQRMKDALAAREAGAVGEAGFREELNALAGEMDKVEFDALRSKLGQEDVDALFKMAAEHPDLRFFESVTARDGLRKMLDGRVPTDGEIKLLRKVYGPEITSEILAKRTLFARMKDTGIQIANIPRSLMSSFDLSAPFRQGVFLVSRPKQFFPAFAKMFKAYGSEDAYKAIEDSIRNSPNFDLMNDSGLAITDLEGLASREERFATSLAEKMPVVEGSGLLRTPARLAAQGYNATVGRGVRASGRAYTAFLTKLRADVFDDLIAKARNAGLDPESRTRSAYANLRDAQPNTIAQDIARFVNAGTGRGNLPTFMRGAAPALNAVFFSPKLMASRVQLMNPLFYAKLDPFARKEAMKSAAGFVAFGVSLIGLAKAAGADVGTNPFSSDFGKIKVGDTRLDVWGGFQQYVRMLAQVAGNKYVSATSGKETKLGEGYKPTTRYDIVMRQIESKEAPVFSFITTMLRQQDYAGQPVSVTNEVAERLTPMYLASIVELAKSDPQLLPFTIPAVFGMGVQTFEAKPSKAAKSSAPSGSATSSAAKPTASLDPYGHDAAIMDLQSRVPPGSSPEVAAQTVAAFKPVYVAPDGARVPIPAGIRYAFASNFATRQDPTSTPVKKWLDAMVKQKRLKAGGTLAFESA